MGAAGGRRHPDAAAIAIGVLLLAIAALTAWDASRLTTATVYGMGPEATPYLVAAGFVALAMGHFVLAFRGALPHREPADLGAILWIAGGLAALILAIGLGAGFILGMTVLFAATARAFGRTAIVTDLLIGLGLGVLIYVVFTRLLTLSLPQGPLERLL